MKIMPTTIPKDYDKYFYNRKKDIKLLNVYLSMLKEDIPNQLLITGKRGVGKTFLLKKLLKDQNDEYLTLYLDLSNIYARKKRKLTEETLMKELLIEIKKTISKDKKLYKKILKKGKLMLNKLKTKDYDLSSEIDIFDIPLITIKDNYEKLSKFVMELPQNIVDSSEKIKGFIIVIDEFQLLEDLESPEAFFWLIRSYSQKQFNVSYIFTGSVSKTSQIINMINGQTGAFGGRMVQINIDPFSREDTENYVLERSNNITFTEEGFNQFYRCTQGIPAYINSLCSILPSDCECDENTIVENMRLNIDHMAIMWIYVWGRLNESEKEIIIKLIENNGSSWTDLVDELEFTKPTISKYLDSLTNKGIVEYDYMEGKYIISDKMLKTWLEIKKEQNGIYPI